MGSFSAFHVLVPIAILVGFVVSLWATFKGPHVRRGEEIANRQFDCIDPHQLSWHITHTRDDV